MSRDESPNSSRPRFVKAAFLALAGLALLGGGAEAFAKGKAPVKESRDASDSKDVKKKNDKNDQDVKGKNNNDKNDKGQIKPRSLGKFTDWEALATPNKDKTCYALAHPLKRQLAHASKRQPEAKLADAQGDMFVSTRPKEGVRNEVAINLGYPTKDNSAAVADIDGDTFELVTMGATAWLKNPAKEKEFVEALKGGANLVVKASSAKGTATTDTYSLKGLSEALARVQQECK
jgi:hypothetical protein